MAGGKKQQDDERAAKKIEVERGISRAIKELDSTSAKTKLGQLSTKWQLADRDASFETQTIHMFRAFDLDYDDNMLEELDRDRGSFGLRELDERINERELEAIGLYHRMHELQMFPEKESEDPDLEKHDSLRKMIKVLEMVFYAKRVVLSAFQAKLAIHQLHVDEGVLDLDQDLDARLGSWALRFRFIDGDTTGFQNLLLYLLDAAMEKKYRKSNGWLYEPIVVDGQDMHSWQAVCEIKDFVYSLLRKETCWDQWKNATHNMKNVTSAIEYLTNCHDHQLPTLVRQRGVYSFPNGVYIAEDDHFHEFKSAAKPLSDSVVSCKFIEKPFEPRDAWRDVPTPYLDSIMAYQEWPPEVREWLYALLGRMLYPLNKFDSWQVIPFFKGLAATGKCFCRDSPIMMHDGSIRPVQDIRVGDEVMGDDSAPRRVLTLARGTDDMFDIVPKNAKFPTYTVTREHVLCLKYSNQGSVAEWKYGKKVSWFDPATKKCRVTKFSHKNEQALADFVEVLDRDRTFEMTVAEYMDLPEYARGYMKAYRVAVEFPTRPAPAFDPWCIGAWLGDGDSAGPRMTSADREIVDGFVEALDGTDTEIKAEKTKYRYGTVRKEGSRSKNGNAFMSALRSYDLPNDKHIPIDLKLGSRATRLAVLAGLLDTDGYFDGRGYEITQKREVLADDIAFVARSLGFAATKTEVVKGCMHDGTLREGTYFRVNVFGDGLDDLPMRLARKRSDGGRRFKNALRYGFDVVPAGRQKYYGFQTDGNHRFLLGDCTVTHNSTIVLKVCKNFFDTVDVGILSNNIERKFGISAFYDKYLIVAPEVRNDLAIEQAEFQSIVSGEDIQVNVKHKKAFSVEWSVPGALAGNEVPSWADSAGSIQRRIVLFEFAKPVRNGDMRLADKLNDELPNIIQKCNKAYLEKARMYSDANIWSVLPAYFANTRDSLAQATNSIEGFLASPDVRVGDDQWCPLDDFKSALKDYEIKNSIPSRRYSNDLFVGPFEKLGLKMCRDTRSYRGVERYRDYVVGVDINIHATENMLG